MGDDSVEYLRWKAEKVRVDGGRLVAFGMNCLEGARNDRGAVEYIRGIALRALRGVVDGGIVIIRMLK